MHGIGEGGLIKVVIFDFDGVLVESLDIKTNAFARLFQEEGPEAVKIVVGYHLNNSGVSRFEKFKYIYKNILKRQLKEDIFKRLCREFSSLVKEEVINASFVPGAWEFLNKFSGQYNCYVISATPQKELEGIIAAKEMKHYFKAVFGAPDEKTEAAKRIITREKISSDEGVYIGDALSDYRAAKANGINFIARICGNEVLFAGLDCLRKPDLLGLEGDLKILGLACVNKAR